MAPGPILRFAPSPNGRLHLGHAFSALFTARAATALGGTFLLRIEDIDPARGKPEFDRGILEDLSWLGLQWPEPVLRQSARMPAYARAAEALKAKGLLYPCFCSRREIAAAASATDPDGAPLYPGTCRRLQPRRSGGAAGARRACAMAAENRSGRRSRRSVDHRGGSRERARRALGRNCRPACRSVALGRCRADPEGRAHKLPFERCRRRCRARRHACHPRLGPPCGDRPPRPAAAPPRPAVPGLLPSPAATGWAGGEAFQVQGIAEPYRVCGRAGEDAAAVRRRLGFE